ncbi:MAG: DUF5915 domain-containing protein [Chloroflexi bacterium]|nr:DUF5915 domain-containing protein [Chloroflexota bacterium]
MLRTLGAQLGDELNVKEVTVGAGSPSFYKVSVRAKPEGLNKHPGPMRPRIMAAFRDATPETTQAWHTQVQAGQPLLLDLAGETVTLAPEDVNAVVEGAPGWAVAVEGGYLAGLSTQVTPELADEGLARELVHRIQTLRRTANFDIADYIVTSVVAGPEVLRVLEKFSEYVRQETLTRELVLSEDGAAGDGFMAETQKVEGHQVTLGVRKA